MTNGVITLATLFYSHLLVLCKRAYENPTSLVVFGGEEFIIFLPKCSGEVTAQIANRLLEEVERMDVPIDESQTPLKVTASIGISTFQPGDTLSSLIERADSALYQAKAEGRNCVRAYQPGKQADVDARQSVSGDNIDIPTEASL